MNNKWLGVILFSFLALLFLYMAGRFEDKVPQEHRVMNSTQMSPPNTITLAAKAEPISREFSGVVIAKHRTDISARLTARVAEVLVEVGDNVNQGDILMRLDSDDLDARVVQTEQALSGAQAKLNAARKEYVRSKELLQKKLVSQANFDNAESQLQTAKANFNQTKAAVSEAQTTFGFSIISAPFSGVITQKPINVGDTASPGNLLVSLYQPTKLQVEAYIAESTMSSIELGEKLNVELPSSSINTYAKVSEITPSADSRSRSYKIKLDLDLVEDVYPGMYAKLNVDVGHRDILRVPMASVMKIGQLDYVNVWNGEYVSRRLVQLGENGRVRKGLVEGEEVVVSP
ncbi:efflux RND transporter periplasmic adaptor subunit [Vibrio sp. ZSDE26]|uniref:Efflux RND transporter periplasmic adaptor subunit n=1 Tax=Vibrio amylolyticus TaxID=2847292 RepID=A0A9X2BL68_9VIBR|nr:efflux RND transporter periplasmic adaptor subunit [Vibrio amylolyticus]MCK6263633.1 efflux RND transporter periplasmic adaptor subunit [Vibrio amylolyticus]